MSSSRFDDLTKALATAGSRRQALKAIGVALGGALGLSRFGMAFAADCYPEGHPCGHGGDKKPCCPGLTCQNHVCVASTTTTAPPTTTTAPPTTPGIESISVSELRRFHEI